MKVDIDLLAEILTEDIGSKKAQLILKKITKTIEKIKQEKHEHKLPTVKKKYIVVLTGEVPEKVQELTGFIVQIPEDKGSHIVQQSFVKAIQQYNITKKGRKWAIHTIGEACEVVGAGIFKEAELYVKSKSPAEVIITRNDIRV